MTEEIIIDGVDVAGCDYFQSKDCWCVNHIDERADICITGNPECENNPFCHYKQLQRLKQENRALKGTDGNVNPDSAYYKITKLEQENEKLLEARNHFMAVNLKYFTALEEIREIAEPRFVNGLNEEADLCNLAMDRITDKINEVLN